MDAGVGNQVIGIVAVNSCDYVATAIKCLNDGHAIVSLRDKRDELRSKLVGVDSIVEPNNAAGWLEAPGYQPRQTDDVGLVQFTSGTEGPPKPILISHAALADTTNRLIEVMDIDSDIREYIGVPVYYSFGFGRARAVLRAGGEAYIPEHGFNPVEISDMLARDEINAVSAVPSLWRIVLANADLFEQTGGKMRWVEIGSQYMSAEEKSRLCELFPNARIVQHYGLTEASRTTFLDLHKAGEAEMNSVGRPEGAIEVAIGDDGRIKIKGPHLASAMLSDTRQQTPLTDSDGWLVTNDIGRLESGFLFFEGRADDLINCGGVKISPDYLETQLYKQLQSDTGIAVTKLPDAMRGETVMVAHLPEVAADALREAANQALREMGLEAGQSLKLMEVDEFPTTQTGKILRKELTAQYQAMNQPTTATPTTNDNEFDQEPRVQELIGLWQEVLQISPVSPHDSFFDLGGDSLSAINVAIRMEKSGIPKSVSRQIFEGKTIAQIVQSSAADGSADVQNDPRVKELIALWEEVLQISPVSPHDSFFDLGGDSLSAINVAMRMEKIGVPKDVSRQIFEGKTIAQIADTSRASTQKEPIAEASRAIDAVRGMLALFVVASHWMPGVVERIPGIADLNQLFSFFYSAGTPGFAIIFGLGVGYAYLPRFQRSRQSVNSLVLRNASLLIAGVVFLAAVRIAGNMLSGKLMAPVDYSNAFFGVLLYYTLAVLSIPIWLSWLLKGRSFVMSAMFLALAMYLVHELVLVWDPSPSTNPILQTGQLLLTARFNYFEVSAYVLSGVGVGYWLRNVVSERNDTGFSLTLGILLMLAGFTLSIRFGHVEYWVIWPKPIFAWMWVLYLGFVLACTDLAFRLAMSQSRSPAADVFLKLMAVFGIMAFPLFIGHELVIPLKNLFVALGMPVVSALTVSIAMFFAAMAYLIMRVYRIYYTTEK